MSQRQALLKTHYWEGVLLTLSIVDSRCRLVWITAVIQSFLIAVDHHMGRLRLQQYPWSGNDQATIVDNGGRLY